MTSATIHRIATRGRTWTGTLRHHTARLRARAEAGMTTAEYAVGTLAACAFAGLLVTIVKSGMVKGLIETLLRTALAVVK